MLNMTFLKTVSVENMLVGLVYGFSFGMAFTLGMKFVDNVYSVNHDRYRSCMEKRMNDRKKCKNVYDRVMMELELKATNDKKMYYRYIIKEWVSMMESKKMHKEKYNHVMHELMNRDTFDFEKMEVEQTEYYDKYRKKYLLSKQMEDYDRQEYLKAKEYRKNLKLKKEKELQQQNKIKELFDKITK